MRSCLLVAALASACISNESESPDVEGCDRAIAVTELHIIEQAVLLFASNNDGRYPGSLEVLIRPDANGHRYLDVDAVPLDPWGRPYVYEPPLHGAPPFAYRIYTRGRDGEPGGRGEDEDIDNRTIKQPSRT